jgi:hypothetical protein
MGYRQKARYSTSYHAPPPYLVQTNLSHSSIYITSENPWTNQCSLSFKTTAVIIIHIRGQKKGKKNPHVLCIRYGFGASSSCSPSHCARVIELTWSMTLTTLAQSSLRYTSRTPFHGSRSTSSLLDAHQTAFDCTQKFI